MPCVNKLNWFERISLKHVWKRLQGCELSCECSGESINRLTSYLLCIDLLITAMPKLLYNKNTYNYSILNKLYIQSGFQNIYLHVQWSKLIIFNSIGIDWFDWNRLKIIMRMSGLIHTTKFAMLGFEPYIVGYYLCFSSTCHLDTGLCKGVFVYIR